MRGWLFGETRRVQVICEISYLLICRVRFAFPRYREKMSMIRRNEVRGAEKERGRSGKEK